MDFSTSAAKNLLEAWLGSAAAGTFSSDYALSALQWCRRLPDLTELIEADLWWTLLNHLIAMAAEAERSPCSDGCSGDVVLSRQLLAGELALTLASLFPEIQQCRELAAKSRRVLSDGLADLLDGDGLLHANYFDRFQPLLACWTRCRSFRGQEKRGVWNGKAETQYQQFFRNALLMARRDGSLVFTDAPSSVVGGCDLLATAVKLAGKKHDRSLLAQWDSKRKANAKRPSKASLHSEWAAAAMMRPDEARDCPRLAILYPNASCHVELNTGKDVLLSGPWKLALTVDGQNIVPTSEWTEICWVSDKDIDYLELELDCGDGLRVQRHFALARKDRFLLLADAVLASKRAKLEYRGTLPLRSNVSYGETCETRQGTLAAARSSATVLPLAFPEPLSRPADGRLSAVGPSLELQHTTEGQSLFAPLFFDLDPHRRKKPLTWRQLTVAESWTIQPNDVAVGYRVAIGRRQWLMYRALARRGNRSLLGHNISSEMLVARFVDGEVESLIEIE
jgi:hypothetical protein